MGDEKELDADSTLQLSAEEIKKIQAANQKSRESAKDKDDDQDET